MISTVTVLQGLISEAAATPYKTFTVSALRDTLALVTQEKFAADGAEPLLRRAVYVAARIFCENDSDAWRRIWAGYLRDLILKLEDVPARTPTTDLAQGLVMPDKDWVKPRRDLQ
ncbi:MAG: hypothetical protein COA69_13565 [Robiginitomaculum sp.]|nr:MAG: hypothetical protein COA69_13565 [Robiginitomaculum sp.]